MSANYVYQIVTGSIGNWNNIKNNHFIDVGTGCHGYREANLNIVGECANLGLTPMVMSGNDGTSNCNGEDPDTVGAYLHNLGFQAVGGESTSQAEADTLQNHLVFETFGGSYGEGDLNPFEPYRLGNNKKSNYVAYIEPYTDYNMYLQETIDVCCAAWDVGCKEVGVLVTQGKGDVNFYTSVAEGVIAARGKFSGFCFWTGCIYSTDDVIANTGEFISGLQSKFPPTNVTMENRIKGVKPTPPKPTPPPYDYAGSISVILD